MAAAFPVAAASAPGAGARIIDLQYGGSFCALRDDGRVTCWGQNDSGSLGDGTNQARSTPALVPGLDQVRQLRGNPPFGFCALRADDSLWCWGFASGRVVTLPAEPTAARPVARDVVAFAFAEGWPGVCARDAGGRVACTEFRTAPSSRCAYWADEARSSCLAKMVAVETVPRPLADAGNVRFDAAPGPYANPRDCFLEQGRVFCRGSNAQGKLGDPSRAESALPVTVPGLSDVTSLEESPTSACVVRADGAALCWGRNNHGELPVAPDRRPCKSGGVETGCNRAPTLLPVRDVIQVLLANGHLSVVTRAGAVMTSRRPGAATAPAVLEAVTGLPPVAKLASNVTYPYVTCALTNTGGVYCLGKGADLGDGAPTQRRQPIQVGNVAGAAEVRVDVAATCVRRTDGTVTCWGDNEAPRGLRDVEALGFPCALARDGRVWCWGSNGQGEMGIGRRGRPGIERDADVARTPLPVPGLRDVSAISSWLGTTCALDRQGAVRCWGVWGPRSRTLSPTLIAGLPPAREVWTGQRRQCALAADGMTWCWKTNVAGTAHPELGRPAHLPLHGPGQNSDKDLCTIDAERRLSCFGAAAPAPALDHVRQISVGWEYGSNISRGCAVLENDELRCWGPAYCADRAALCAPGIWNRATTILTGVRQVSVGSFHACAVRNDQTVWCWGAADGGRLGDENARTERIVRVELPRAAP